MEESNKKMHVEGGDKEILYSKAIKAGKRIYYLDVKKNLKDDLFLAITESKKILSKEGMPVSFEKHKIFLYKEDFDKFMNGMTDVIDYIKKKNIESGKAVPFPSTTNKSLENENEQNEDSDDFNFDIEF